MYDEDAVCGEMDVEFDAGGAEFSGPTEGGERVLGAFPGGSPVGDDLGNTHAFILTSGGVPASYR